MKIAFDHQTFTLQSYGGISRYYTILADKLIKQNQNVKVFAGLHRNNYVAGLPKDVLSGIKLEKYPPKLGRIFQWLNHGFSQGQTKLWQPDLVHETYYSSLPSLHSNAVRVTSVYDMIHELFKDQFPARDNTSASKKATFNRVDHIISISHSTKNDLVQLFDVDESKVSVVHLGVDLQSFKQVRVKNALGEPYILYVGSRGGYKNFSGFLKACASSILVKNKIKIVAFGGGKFTSNELSLIHQLGFIDNKVVQVSGNDAELATLYANALCFVYPSLYEGFGLPPLEAMAAGCPVVSSNTSSMPEVVKEAGIYFDPLNVESICAAVENLIEDEALQSELRLKGYKNIEHFSWHKCANETLSIYKKLTGKE